MIRSRKTAAKLAFAPIDAAGNAHVGFAHPETARGIVPEFSSPATLVYFAPIALEVTTAATTPLFAMLNSHATRSIYLRRFVLGVSFNATAIGNSYQTINFERVTGTALTISGGVNITPIKRSSGQGASILAAADIEQNTDGTSAITVSASSATLRLTQMRVPIGVTSETFVWTADWAAGLTPNAYPRLAPGSLQLFQFRTANAKLSCTGWIEWEER